MTLIEAAKVKITEIYYMLIVNSVYKSLLHVLKIFNWLEVCKGRFVKFTESQKLKDIVFWPLISVDVGMNLEISQQDSFRLFAKINKSTENE